MQWKHAQATISIKPSQQWICGIRRVAVEDKKVSILTCHSRHAQEHFLGCHKFHLSCSFWTQRAHAFGLGRLMHTLWSRHLCPYRWGISQNKIIYNVNFIQTCRSTLSTYPDLREPCYEQVEVCWLLYLLNKLWQAAQEGLKTTNGRAQGAHFLPDPSSFMT